MLTLAFRMDLQEASARERKRFKRQSVGVNHVAAQFGGIEGEPGGGLPVRHLVDHSCPIG